MKKIIYLILIVAVAVLSWMNKPTTEEHKAAIMAQVTGAISDELSSSNKVMDFLGSVGTAIGSKAAEAYIDTQMEMEDYYVCNVAMMEIDGEKKSLSIGVFGNVFTTFDKDDLKEAIRNK